MIVNRLKTLSIALAISAVATGSMAEGTATKALPDETGRAAGPVAEVPDLPKSEAYLWEFAGIPRKGRAILVNIPSYELIAFRDGQPVLRSKVIVGTRRNPTPVMRTETSVVRFRPTWTPTPKMIRNGTRPGMRRPGRRNPLGLLAVRLEPGMLIYLHGTNKPHLFKRKNRSLSHGCIRVEKWDQVAAFALNTTINEVHAHANGRRTFDMDTEFVPVVLGYYTKFPDADGNWKDYRDIYGRGRDGPAPAVAGTGGQDHTFKVRDKSKPAARTTRAKAKSRKSSNVKPVSMTDVMSSATPIGPNDKTFKLK